ncbi:MAG: hypothetical protein E7319_01590 [Clostridiales bacterium]|nr:hypothetical protein [Clostridiales bacterium]
MSDPTPRRRRSERTEQLYTARMLPDEEQYTQNQPSFDSIRFDDLKPVSPFARPKDPQPAADASAFMPNEPEPAYDLSQYTPNEQEEIQAILTQQPAPEKPREEISFETDHSALTANLSAYYRRAANVSQQEEDDPFADARWSSRKFIEPVRKESPVQMMPAEDAMPTTANIYRPLDASWAEEDRQSMMDEEEFFSYQVQEEDLPAPGKRRRKQHTLKNVLLIAAVLVLAGIGVYLFRDQIFPQEATPSPTYQVQTTPRPVRGYDAAPAVAISADASQSISRISGTLDMEPTMVNESNILTRNQREDGLFDFYLFAAKDGRLLGYYDGLDAEGMLPLKDGGFYVAMPPYLIDKDGKVMVSTKGLEELTGHSMTVGPMMNGWAQIVADDGDSNLINADGETLSRLWFSRSFPMTGDATVGYADTGNLSTPETRYTLYIATAEGNTVKWRDAADDQGVVACAMGLAYLQNGELYLLDQVVQNPAADPLLTTDQLTVYADCDAMVVRDPQSGKYALYVHGEQHYDFLYDSILPVESEIAWQGTTFNGPAGQATVLSVRGAAYPLPLSHYFVLTRDGAQEHVALSTGSNCPIILD